MKAGVPPLPGGLRLFLRLHAASVVVGVLAICGTEARASIDRCRPSGWCWTSDLRMVVTASVVLEISMNKQDELKQQIAGGCWQLSEDPVGRHLRVDHG